MSFFFLLSPGSRYVARTDRSKRARSQAARQLNAPRLWLKQRVCAPQARGRQAAGLAQARPKARDLRGRTPTSAPTGLVLYALRERKHRPAPDMPAILRLQTAGPAGALCKIRRLPASASSRIYFLQEVLCHQEPVSDQERTTHSIANE